jgi:sentrin-specific protease 8
VREKALCLLPVNDNQSFDSESSHWSLLVYENQRFVHYDSSAGHNTTAAKKIARTFLQLLSASGVDNVPTWSSGLFVNDRDAPQQQNGYDCGMYVLVVAEFLCRQRCRREVEGAAAISLRDYATADRVTALRLEIPRIVQWLQEDKLFAVQRS